MVDKTKEECLAKVLDWCDGSGYYDREWLKHRFVTPGWPSGNQDVEVWVRPGSADKGIIIINNGYSTIRAIMFDRVYKRKWGDR